MTVSSSRRTMLPALTRWPSRTNSSPTTPPVGCWIFFTLVSTTTDARRDDGAGQLGGCGPAADAADQQDGDDGAAEEVMADRAALVVCLLGHRITRWSGTRA